MSKKLTYHARRKEMIHSMRIAICDDDQQVRSILHTILDTYPEKKDFVIQEYSDGINLELDLIEDPHRFDLVFLDIYLGNDNGLETARHLRQRGINTPIAFLTTSRDYAVESYEVEAVDYLLKPLSADRVYTVLKKQLLRLPSQPEFVYRKGNDVRHIPHRDILFVESANHRLYLHLKDEVLDFIGRIDQLENQLNNPCFLRCHQSFLVNMHHIVKLDEQFIMDNGEVAHLRKRDRKKIRDQYWDWLLKESF